MPRHPNAIAALTIACAVTLAGCAGGSPGATGVDAASPSPAPSVAASASTTNVARPSSSAVMALVSPTQGESVTGGVVHVVVSLTGATIVSATTTNIRPDQGHIHLYVDNNLVSMNYGTQQDLPIAPGTHILHVEFVASDHVPFNPRVISPDVVFTVKP